MAMVQKIRCQVIKIMNHGDRVYSVDMKPEKLIPKFLPGQFLHLALDDYDPSGFWPESRVFSIASSPEERDRLSISYSVKGRFTTRMEKELLVGKRVWVKLPYGDFIVKNDSDVALIAGGTGITAFTAFIENLSANTPYFIYLIYGVRNGHLLLYKEKIELIAQKISQLIPIYFVENKERGFNFLKNSTRIEKGVISLDKVWSNIKNPFKTKFYLSGPPQMLSHLKKELFKRGISETLIKIDFWG